ncbi:hypothetical protein HYZ05_01170 [Candidatus Daviesbacteria bacterium]|nr:hypothetical protein [Candidatus Daviesbacteria bacterium]
MASDQFVSRGGEKLQAAIENWKLNLENLTCLDVGSSTGGFVDCLLQNGAKKVYALDTAYGELAWKLRNDERVVVMERVNILHLESLPSSVMARSIATKQSRKEITTLPVVARNDNVRVDLITIDAGWTKLELVLPVVKKFLKPGGTIIALVKPHYEADKKLLVKGVLTPEIAEQVKNEVLKWLQVLGFRLQGEMESPILGGGGNKEYLLLIS